MIPISLGSIAAVTGGRVRGDPGIVVTGSLVLD
jgi:hypothetical protein